MKELFCVCLLEQMSAVLHCFCYIAEHSFLAGEAFDSHKNLR